MKVLRWCHLYVVVVLFVCFRSKCRRQKKKIFFFVQVLYLDLEDCKQSKAHRGKKWVFFMSLLYGTAVRFNQIQIHDLCHPLNKRKTAC